MSPFRRLRRWWVSLPLGVLVALVYAAWPGTWSFTVSPETTYVTGPLDAEGYVDYPTALNERLGQGITPDQNANVLIVRALGPRPEGAELPAEYYRWLGIDPPPDQGEYLLSWDKYFEAHLKNQPEEEEPRDWFDEFFGADPDEVPVRKDRREEWNDRVDRARKWPWKAKDRPEIADWLKRNEKPLALMVEASKRPRYFHPLVSKNPTPQSAQVLNSLLPTVQKCREVARALSCRAMARVDDGDLDGAWQDLLACHRLGRLVGSGGTVIQELSGLAITQIAATGELALLSHSRTSSKQVLAWLADLRRLPPIPSVAEKVDLGERFLMLDILMSMACRGPEVLNELDRSNPKPPPNGFWSRLFTRSIDLDPAFRNANRMFDRLVDAGRLPARASRQAEFGAITQDIIEMKAAVSELTPLERAAADRTRRGEFIGNVVIGLLLPAYEKIYDAADRTEQSERNVQVAFALAAYRADHGKYPASLDELAPKYLPKVPGDLFSGGPLIYLPEGDGYLLYSVGVNGTDEDGRGKDDDPKGDDLVVRMPVPEPKEKPKGIPVPGVRGGIID